MGFWNKIKRLFADDYESVAELYEDEMPSKYNNETEDDYDEEEITWSIPVKSRKEEVVVKEEKEVVTSCINEHCHRKLDLITIADTHGKANFDEISEVFQKGSHPDAIILLGDIPAEDLETILDAHGFINSVPIFGICGNHDPKGLFESRPGYGIIQNLDGKVTQLHSGIRIGGLSGSIKYKEDDYYHLITQKESVDILDRLPMVDILITHDKPCFEKPDDENYAGISMYAHSGLYGIGKYILEKGPKLVLHGHLHDTELSKCKQTGTIIRCCYGVERFLATV